MNMSLFFFKMLISVTVNMKFSCLARDIWRRVNTQPQVCNLYVKVMYDSFNNYIFFCFRGEL